MKATEQYVHAVLLIIPYRVVIIFKSVDETLVCDYMYSKKGKLLSSTFMWYLLQKVAITFYFLKPTM